MGGRPAVFRCGPLSSVEVEGLPAHFAQLDDNTYEFEQKVFVNEGVQTLQVIAIGEGQPPRVSTNWVTVTAHEIFPQISIISPLPSQEVTNSVTVVGTVRYPGNLERVDVAGQQVDFSPAGNNTYEFSRVLTFNEGEQAIRVVAVGDGQPHRISTNWVTVIAHAINPVLTIHSPQNGQHVTSSSGYLQITGTVKYSGELNYGSVLGHVASFQRVGQDEHSLLFSLYIGSLDEGMLNIPVVAVTKAVPPICVTNTVSVMIHKLKILSPVDGSTFGPPPVSLNVSVQTESTNDTILINGQMATGSGYLRTATLSFTSAGIHEIQVASVASSASIRVCIEEWDAPSSNTNDNDMVCVLDVSGSMENDERADQVLETSYLISNLSTNDRLSVVSFDDAAITEVPLAQMSKTMKRDVVSILGNMGGGGGTEITNGLNCAFNMLKSVGRTNALHTVMLSTDDNNIPEGYVEAMPTRVRIVTQALRDHSYSWNEWNADFLSWLAQRRNGIFLAAPTRAGWMTVACSNGLMAGSSVVLAGSVATNDVYVDASVKDVSFVVNSRNLITSNLSVTLSTPGGATVTASTVSLIQGEYCTYPGNTTYMVKNPAAGLWHIITSNTTATVMTNAVCAYSKSGKRADFVLDRIQYAADESIPIRLAAPADTTSVWLEITNVWSGVGYRLEMLNNGSAANGDASATDDVYSCLFTNTSVNDCSWRLTAHVAGEDAMCRVTERSIYIGGDWAQLSTPMNVIGSDNFSDKVVVSWSNNVREATHYEVLRAPISNSRYIELVGVVSNLVAEETMTWTDRDPAVMEQQHYYWVRAYTDRLQHNISRHTDSELSMPDIGCATGQ